MTAPPVPERGDARGSGGEPGGGSSDPTPRSRLGALHRARLEVTSRVLRTRERLEHARPSSTLVDSTFGALERDVGVAGTVLSGAVAYRVFLFLVPYVFVVIMLFGITADLAKESPQHLANNTGIAGIAASGIKNAAGMSVFGRVVAIVGGLFALYLATRGLLKVLVAVHRLVWDLPPGSLRVNPRLVGGFVAAVTVAAATGLLLGLARQQSFVLGLLVTVLFIAVPSLLWLLLSWYLPRPDIPWWALVPGSVLFGLGAELLHILSVYFIPRWLAHKSDTYGTLGSALAILLWAYLLGRVVTAAVVLNASLWERRTRTLHLARTRANAPAAGREPGPQPREQP